MIQKIKTFIMVGVASFAMAAPGLALAPLFVGVAHAETIQENLCQGSNDAAGSSGNTCDKAGTGSDPSAGIAPLAQKVVKFFSIVVGAVAVIMVVFGGFRYITSGGDSNRVGSAKNTLIYAVIGLIIVAIAQILVHFVINTAADTGGQFK